MKFKLNAPERIDLRRALRQSIPEPENKLWYYLRNRRLNKLKFRRQYSIGRYVTDFCCPEKRLIVEVDGDSHYTDDAREHDRERDAYLMANGFTILRFTNDEVMGNIDGVLESIAENCTSPPAPLLN